MKKQRMQADNVEQLMEIVRALQNGEEPDIEKIKEKDRRERARRAEEARQAQIAARQAREARKRAAREEAEREAAKQEEAQRRKEAGADKNRADKAGAQEHEEQPAKGPSEPEEKQRHRTLGGPAWLHDTASGTESGQKSQPKKASGKGRPTEKEVEVPDFPEPVAPYFDEESETEFLRFLEEEETASLPPVITLLVAAVSKAADGVRNVAGQVQKGIAARKQEEAENGSASQKREDAENAEKDTVSRRREDVDEELKELEETIRSSASAAKTQELSAASGGEEPASRETGTGEFRDGAASRETGTGEFRDGAASRETGTGEFRDGAASRETGTDEFRDGAVLPERPGPELPGEDPLAFLDDDDDEPLPQFGTREDRKKGTTAQETETSGFEDDVQEKEDDFDDLEDEETSAGNRFLAFLRRPGKKKNGRKNQTPKQTGRSSEEETGEEEEELLIEDVDVRVSGTKIPEKTHNRRELPGEAGESGKERSAEDFSFESAGEKENFSDGPAREKDGLSDRPAREKDDLSDRPAREKDDFSDRPEEETEDTAGRTDEKKESRAEGIRSRTGRDSSRGRTGNKRGSASKGAGGKRKPPAVPAWVLPVVLAVAVVAAGVFLVRLVGNAITENAKRKHVKSEDGLVISVEQQPSDWVNYAQVVMKLHGEAAAASAASVNGTDCAVAQDGTFTVEASQPVLQVSVTSEAGTQHAQVTIPKIDNSAPTVTATHEEEKAQVLLKAEDDASGVDIIYYHIGEAGVEPQLTDYLEYREPIAWEDGKVYRYYARDKAGNRTAPVASTLEDPDSISLTQQNLALFPGDTVQLEIAIEPELALLRNLTYSSSDPDVASVDVNGLLTAGAEGNAEITVRAEGVSDVFCNVSVDASRTVTITGLGDCTLGTYPSVNAAASFDAYAQMYGYSWFFDKVREFLEQDDATFANLEGPLTTAEGSADKQFVFKGSPEYTQILTDGSVEVVTLANNHSEDYGEQGLNDTKSALDAAGIPYCVGDTVTYLDLNHVKTAFIGIYEPSLDASYEERTRSTINQAKEEGAQLIIIAYHWGGELVYEPVDIQTEIGHLAIDLGADLVIGHHPHVVNGIEKYNGHYIVYSVGNFCFGGSTSPTDPDAMIVQQSFTVSEAGTEPGDLKVIPIRTSSDYSINNYQPMILEGDEALRVMNKINQYCAPFGTNFSYN